MEDKAFNSFCTYHCSSEGCAFLVTVRDGKAIHLERHPKMKYAPCAKMWTYLSRLYHPDRILYPMKRVGKRGEGKWERISWDEALDTVCKNILHVKETYGNDALFLYHYVAHMGIPSGFMGLGATLHKLFNLWGGCIPSYQRGSLCWQAFISASNYLYGTYKVVTPPDEECELIIIWGSNPALGAARGQMLSFLRAKEKGAKFIVIDPIFTDTVALLADEWVPIRPGTDLALALAIMKILIENGFFNEAFLLERSNAAFLVREDNGRIAKEEVEGKDFRTYEDSLIMEGTFKRKLKEKTKYLVWDSLSKSIKPYDTSGIKPALHGVFRENGLTLRPVWEVLKEHVKPWTPNRAEEETGVTAQTIEKIALQFGKAHPAKIYFICGGLQRTSWGENATYALGMLNVLKGAIQGAVKQWDPRIPVTDIGLCETALKMGTPNPVKKRVPISQLAEAILNPKAYNTQIKALYVLNGNPVGQHPDSNKTIKALTSQELEFIVVSDIFMSETAKYADILLPASTILERDMIFESCDETTLSLAYLYHLRPKQHILYAERAMEPLGESKDDFDIICMLAQRLGFGKEFPWKRAEEWIEYLLEEAKKNPNYPWLKDITIERLKREGVVEVDVAHPSLMWDLQTPSGRIELYNETLLEMGYDPIPIWRNQEEGPKKTPELFKKYPLAFFPFHYKFTVNSTFANQPEIRELDSNPLLMNPKDAQPRRIKDGDKVVVFNERGRIQTKVKVTEEIIPGAVSLGHTGWEKYGNTGLLTSDRLSSGYGENPTPNTCLVEVEKVEEGM